MIAIGPPGPSVVAKDSKQQLKDAVRSIVKFEENSAVIETKLKAADYEKVPVEFEPRGSNADISPYLGWHKVTLDNNRNSTSVFLPDRRFATDPNAYEKEMERRLDWLCDKKFVARTPPGLLIKNSHMLQLKSKVPSGTSILVYDGKVTYWADGGDFAPDPKMDAARAETSVEKATRELIQAVLDRKAFESPGGVTEWSVVSKVVMPGQEHNGYLRLRKGPSGEIAVDPAATKNSFEMLFEKCGIILERANLPYEEWIRKTPRPRYRIGQTQTLRWTQTHSG
jgi:hypothetical protein